MADGQDGDHNRSALSLLGTHGKNSGEILEEKCEDDVANASYACSPSEQLRAHQQAPS